MICLNLFKIYLPPKTNFFQLIIHQPIIKDLYQGVHNLLVPSNDINQIHTTRLLKLLASMTSERIVKIRLSSKHNIPQAMIRYLDILKTRRHHLNRLIGCSLWQLCAVCADTYHFHNVLHDSPSLWLINPPSSLNSLIYLTYEINWILTKISQKKSNFR